MPGPSLRSPQVVQPHVATAYTQSFSASTTAMSAAIVKFVAFPLLATAATFAGSILKMTQKVFNAS